MFKMELNSSNVTTNITNEEVRNLATSIAAATEDVKIIVYLLITVVVAVTGTTGNLLVIGALMVHKRLHVLSNVFIGNLAVADLHVTAIVNPSIITAVLHPDFFIKYPVLCEVLAVICLTACLCSVWSISAISLNRYVAICHRAFYPRIYNRVTVPCYVALMWMYAFTLVLPNFFGWGGHVLEMKAYFCNIDYAAHYSYNLFFFFFGLSVPMFITCFSYVSIFLYARKTQKQLQKYSKTVIQATDLRLLKTLCTIFATFILMWTPLCIILLFDVYHWPQWYWLIAVALAHANSSINSILYAATNKNFREGYATLIKLVCCCCSGDNVISHDKREDSSQVRFSSAGSNIQDWVIFAKTFAV